MQTRNDFRSVFVHLAYNILQKERKREKRKNERESERDKAKQNNKREEKSIDKRACTKALFRTRIVQPFHFEGKVNTK